MDVNHAEPLLSVVVVNWNAGAHLAECLCAVAESAASIPYEVIVVDNASTDQSLAAAAAVGVPHQVIRNDLNLGYTVANNQGARRARAPYLLFLNPDAMPLGDALPALVAALARDPQLGVIAPRLVDADGRSSRDMGGRFPSWRTIAGSFLLLSRLAPRWFPGMTRTADVTAPERCDWVCGAAFAMRRLAWEQVPWNEELFLHGEDVELCSRVHDAGWEIAVTPEATVAHVGGASIARQKNVDILVDSRSGIALHLERHASAFEQRAALATMRLGMRLRRALHGLRAALGNPSSAARAHKLRLFLAQDRQDVSESRSARTRAPQQGPTRSASPRARVR